MLCASCTSIDEKPDLETRGRGSMWWWVHSINSSYYLSVFFAVFIPIMIQSNYVTRSLWKRTSWLCERCKGVWSHTILKYWYRIRVCYVHTHQHKVVAMHRTKCKNDTKTFSYWIRVVAEARHVHEPKIQNNHRVSFSASFSTTTLKRAIRAVCVARPHLCFKCDINLLLLF